MNTLSKLVFVAMQLLALLGFGFFSIIIVPAIMFLCGSENAVGYSKDDPNEFGIAVLITVVWTCYLMGNIALPYIKDHIVLKSPVIKPGTWHSGSFK